MKAKEEGTLGEDHCDVRCIHSERIVAARQKALAEAENDRLVQLFKALGDPTRLRMIWALTQDEMCVCDLAAFLGVTESAVSHQLRLLRQLRLVRNRREGPVLYYRIADDELDGLVAQARTLLRKS